MAKATRAAMEDKELAALVDAEFVTALGADGGDISSERAKALRYYLSKLRGDEEEGQSSVVTSDVADVVDGMMPALLRIFTIADNLVSFDPVSADDIAKAEQESDYVSYVFWKQNPAFITLFCWMWDALVQKNGVVKAFWDETERVTQESYRGLTDQQAADLLDDEELEPIERAERTETERVLAPLIAPDGGMMQIEVDVPVTVHDIVCRRINKRGKVTIKPVAPEHFRISADASSIDPNDARMTGEEYPATRDWLLGQGFDEDTVLSLPKIGSGPRTQEEIARNDKSDEQSDDPKDALNEEVLVQECFIRCDFDGDGRAELRHVIKAGGTILQNEIADRSIYHVVTAVPLPHKHFGRALAEKVIDVQDVNTTLTRQIQNNLYRTNQPEHAVWENAIGENTIDDLLTTRVGSIKRFTRPVNEAYAPITVPFTAGASLPMLQHWEKVKWERTGVSPGGEALSPDLLKNIQQGVMGQAFDKAAEKTEAIARIFAETGIKSLFLHIHELLLKHQNKPLVTRLRGEFVEVDPREWRTRLDMTVNIGLGIGTRHTNLLHLEAIWAKQIAMIEKGGTGLVTAQNLYNTAADFVRNANLKNPALYFTRADQLSPPTSQQQQLAEMQAQLQARQQELEKTKQDLAREKMLRQDRREGERIELQRQKQETDHDIAQEELSNDVVELALKYDEKPAGRPRHSPNPRDWPERGGTQQ